MTARHTHMYKRTYRFRRGLLLQQDENGHNLDKHCTTSISHTDLLNHYNYYPSTTNALDIPPVNTLQKSLQPILNLT